MRLPGPSLMPPQARMVSPALLEELRTERVREEARARRLQRVGWVLATIYAGTVLTVLGVGLWSVWP